LALRPFLATFALLLVHCGSSGSSDPPPSTAALPATPVGACGTGTMPSLGQTACAPVGPTACADGFQRGAGGWSCEAVRPASACSGATRAALGNASCVPVSDCDAAFPPAGFEVVHDAAGLTAALSSLRFPKNIALDSGTYDGVELDSNVQLVGRCASKVILKGAGTGRGILVQGTAKASVKGVTITGFKGAVVVANGGTLDLAGVAMLANPYGIVASNGTVNIDGAVLEGPPATGPRTGQGLVAVNAESAGVVTIANADIREYEGVAIAIDRGKATLRRSVITSYANNTYGSHLFAAYSDGALTVEESSVAIRAADETFAIVGRILESVSKDANPHGGTLRFVSSDLSKADFEDPAWLFGTHEGGHIELEGSTVRHRADAAFDVRDAESTLSIKDSAIVSTAQSGVPHSGVTVFSGASAALEGVAFVSPSASAIFVGDMGSRVSMKRSLVTGMHSGAGASALVSDRQATLTVDDSVVMDSEGYALIGNAGSKIELGTSIFDGAAGGLGVAVTDLSSLAMDGCLTRGQGDAALTFVVGAQGVITNSSFVDNQVALHLDRSRLVDAPTPGALPGIGEVVLVGNTFTNNATYTSTAPTTLIMPPSMPPVTGP
jgi:hypothetical protein